MKPSMFSRLHRLAARAETGAGPKGWVRARELEAFNRAAEQYIRAAREYLHMPDIRLQVSALTSCVRLD